VVLSKDAATALETRIQHLRVVAAIVSTHPAIAIYDGQATHLRSFYLEESSSECPISVLSAVDRLPDEHGRVVFIAFDPGRFGAPDLVVTTPVIGAAEAYNFLVNLCWYVIARGKPLLAGETVGRSASEILELREARHPIDAKRRVLRVELPGS
jgi:hypothetical protein